MKKGQVIVEMLLILPVFLTIVFCIMEMGHMAFQMILVNHAAFETARYGSMTATPRLGGNPGVRSQDLEGFLKRMLPKAKIFKSFAQPTLTDPQAGVSNHDLVITVWYPVPLIFPISNYMLSKPMGSGTREIYVTMRMPVERPLPK